MTMKLEIRNNSVIIEGYVNAVGRDSRVMRSMRGKFVEQIVPGTFDKALKRNSEIRLLFNHNQDKILGSTSSGELKLKEDSIGLKAQAVVTDAEVVEKAKRGELRGWSFGFFANSDDWEELEDGLQRRYLKDIDLDEVSILNVTPAYYGTSIETGEEFSERRSLEFDEFENNFTEKKKEEKYERNYKKELEIIKLRGGNYNE